MYLLIFVSKYYYYPFFTDILVVPISVFIVAFAFLLVFHTGMRTFFNLYLQVGLEILGRVTGFSKLFDETKVEDWEERLKVLKRRRTLKIRDGTSDSGYDSFLTVQRKQGFFSRCIRWVLQCGTRKS